MPTFSSTCKDCGATFTSPFRRVSLGTHRGSKDCLRRVRERQLAATESGELPKVWRWILRGVIDLGPSTLTEHLISVPSWVAEVIDAAFTTRGQYTLATLDTAAERALPFIEACKKDQQLIEAFRAAVKLGGQKAGATFMGDHQTFIRAFCGRCR